MRLTNLAGIAANIDSIARFSSMAAGIPRVSLRGSDLIDFCDRATHPAVACQRGLRDRRQLNINHK